MHTGIKNAPRSCVRRSPALTHSKQQAASVSRVSCLPAVVIVVLLSRASKAEAAICMEINSTAGSCELLFNRGRSVTAHHQLMDSSSHACPLPSPGLMAFTQPVPGLADLIKIQEWGKDWQTREERTCNERNRGAGACTLLRNRDVFIGGHS